MTDIFPLPNTYDFGKVVGRAILAIADTTEDVDNKPQARATKGTVTFTPLDTGAKVTAADYTAIVMNVPVTTGIDPDTGEIIDAEGNVGIWLITGQYRVNFNFEPLNNFKGAVPPFNIEVLDTHTDAAPLDLASAIPPSVPPGALVQLVALPANPETGDVLTYGISGMEWAPTGAGAGTVTSVNGVAPDGTGNVILVAANLPAASLTGSGVVELATTAETLTGTDAVRATTPAGVKAAIDARGYTTSADVTTLINGVINGAPGALDTLFELAAALGNDANFATTITNALAARVRVDTAAQGLTTTQKANARTNIGAKDVAWTPALTDLPINIPLYVFQASDGTWPTTTAEATRHVEWYGYPGLTNPPAMTGRPNGVALVDGYSLRLT